jgi:hypothetical protein
MVMITAVEMARAKGIDPKRFRASLRSDRRIDWHGKYDPWCVEDGSERHADMKRVLDQF